VSVRVCVCVCVCVFNKHLFKKHLSYNVYISALSYINVCTLHFVLRFRGKLLLAGLYEVYSIL